MWANPSMGPWDSQVPMGPWGSHCPRDSMGPWGSHGPWESHEPCESHDPMGAPLGLGELQIPMRGAHGAPMGPGIPRFPWAHSIFMCPWDSLGPMGFPWAHGPPHRAHTGPRLAPPHFERSHFPKQGRVHTCRESDQSTLLDRRSALHDVLKS